MVPEKYIVETSPFVSKLPLLFQSLFRDSDTLGNLYWGVVGAFSGIEGMVTSWEILH